PSAARIRLEDIAIRSRFGPSSVSARRECFEKSGLFDTELGSAEDRDMWIRIAGNYPVANLKVPLWWYRIHSASMSFAAERMVRFERKVLAKAFAQQSLLRRKWLTRLQSYSYFARSAAHTFDTAGQRAKALAQILYSLA